MSGLFVDVVLMDVQMPVMDGISAVKAMRQQGDKTPVVALTANAMKEDRGAVMLAGFDDFIEKPVDIELLFSTLAKYLTPVDSQVMQPVYSSIIGKVEDFEGSP